ncbi:MAG: class I SAM-dependent methyltransferase, partial [Desulfobacterales bacterium]|nr:class I SAM-dependent methyltransferase [Desulfobacterales bacterium]
GIGYSLIGAFILLPPVLDRIFKQREKPGKARGTVNERVLNRYRNLESYPRMFARFKMRFDPMFSELGNFVGANQNIRTIIDIGCGHGVPGNWLLECFPGAKIYGIDPDPNHVRTASMSMGRDGVINRGRAPHVPEAPLDADVAMLLDIMHYLKDNDLKLTLDRLRRHLVHEGLLIIRAVIPPTRRFPFIWWLENFKLRISKTDSYYRSEEAISTMIRNAGFRIVHSGPSGGNEESVWFIAQVDS